MKRRNKYITNIKKRFARENAWRTHKLWCKSNKLMCLFIACVFSLHFRRMRNVSAGELSIIIVTARTHCAALHQIRINNSALRMENVKITKRCDTLNQSLVYFFSARPHNNETRNMCVQFCRSAIAFTNHNHMLYALPRWYTSAFIPFICHQIKSYCDVI